MNRYRRAGARGTTRTVKAREVSVKLTNRFSKDGAGRGREREAEHAHHSRILEAHYV